MDFRKISLPPSQPERDALELKTRYTSVSHKTMAEIPWPAGVSAPVPKREVKPDVVTEKVPRYEEKAHAWQALGPAFDRASPRRHFLSAKPINYTSESRQTRYTPGYTGRVALKCGELGVPDIDVVKKTEVHRELPPPTSVARKANIVGYTGIVKPGSVNHTHYNAPCTTQLRTHRSYPPIGKSQGPMYPRVNPVSNMVSLTHPYNPYNKINPTVKPRA